MVMDIRRVVACATLAVFASACSLEDEDAWSNFESDVRVWGETHVFSMSDGNWYFRPYVRKTDGKPCIAYSRPGSGGGRCFVTDWAVESSFEAGDDEGVLIAITKSEVARVSVPFVDGSVESIRPKPLPRFGVGMATLRVQRQEIDRRGNLISAFDAAGNKLGNEHNNVSARRDCPYFGPWDGRLDAGQHDDEACASAAAVN